MLEKETSIWMVSNTVVISIPQDVYADSAFPFVPLNIKEAEDNKKEMELFKVKIKIDKERKRLIIEKLD